MLDQIEGEVNGRTTTDAYLAHPYEPNRTLNPSSSLQAFSFPFRTPRLP